MEDLIAACEIQKVTGELQVEHRGEGKIYRNLLGSKVLESYPEKGLYFAAPPIVRRFLP